MSATLDISEETGMVVLRLPPRDLRSFGFLGGGCLISAVVFACIIYAVAIWVAPQQLPLIVESFWIPIVMGVIGFLALVIYFVGSATEFQVVNSDLRITEMFGPLRWTWGCRLASIQQLKIKHFIVSGRQELAPPPSPDDRAVLFIECRGQPEIQCAHGYRREQLVGLAEKLSQLCAEIPSLEQTAARTIAVVEEDEATLFEEQAEQPLASRIVCERHVDGVTLFVPPEGVRGAGRLLLFSPGVVIAFLHFGIPFLAALPNPNLFDIASMLIGLLISIGYGWAVLAKARRQAAFAVVGDQLLLMLTGMLSNKRSEWNRSDLYDIRSADSGIKQKRIRVFELQIWKRDGSKVVCLRNRSEEELRWMATVLRRAMRLPLKKEDLAVKSRELAFGEDLTTEARNRGEEILATDEHG